MPIEFRDISADTQETYVVDAPGKHVFFVHNRSGKITVEMRARNTEAYIVGLYTGAASEQFDLETVQHHVVGTSTSDLFIKGVFNGQAKMKYEGLIRIEKDAQQSHAYQKNQNLIASDQAFVDSRPNLEILANDVFCTHGSSTGRLNQEQVQYVQSRGLTKGQAQKVLTEGFVRDVFLRLEQLGVDQAQIAALPGYVESV